MVSSLAEIKTTCLMYCQEWVGKIVRVVVMVCKPRARVGGGEGAALVCVYSDEAFILEC